jgi:hypothetical protein
LTFEHTYLAWKVMGRGSGKPRSPEAKQYPVSNHTAAQRRSREYFKRLVLQAEGIQANSAVAPLHHPSDLHDTLRILELESRLLEHTQASIYNIRIIQDASILMDLLQGLVRPQGCPIWPV